MQNSAKPEVSKINEYKERNSGSDEFPLCWPSPTEEDIAFLAELE